MATAFFLAGAFLAAAFFLAGAFLAAFLAPARFLAGNRLAARAVALRPASAAPAPLVVDRLDHVVHHLALALQDPLGEVEGVVDDPLEVLGHRRDDPLGALGDALGELTAGVEQFALGPLDHVIDVAP